MLKSIIKIIHTLRVFFLAFILIYFLLILGINPVDVGKFIGAKFGSAVGMSISVPENPFNRLALQLKEKEERLVQKEQELNQKESELDSANNFSQNKLVFILMVGIIILFVLVLLNYYFDYRRKKKAKNLEAKGNK